MTHVAPRMLLLLVTCVTLLRAAVGSAQPVQVLWPDDRKLTFDPSFTIGTLPSGLTFYIRHHDQPAKRVSLQLIVKTGSLHEDDNERGYAHFVEHMAFNGTKHFKPGELVKFFEERGARFGAHVNASTTFDSTIYFLTVPSDKPELLDKGLLALADFAGAVSFDQKEVDRERPIIIEEWRQRQGVGMRVQEKQTPVLFRGSRYVDRLPIGTRESVQSATAKQLKRFYDAWYRPDRMAVVVVGDVDAARARTLIGQHFAKVKGRTRPRAEPDVRVPLDADLTVSIVTDRELRSTSASLLRKMPSAGKDDVATVRRGQVQGLARHMLNARLDERARRQDAPFLGASFTSMGLGQDVDAYGFSVRTRDGQLAPGLEAALVEGKRVRDHGFVQTELDRARQTVRASVESGYKDRAKIESGMLASACRTHFLTGAVFLSADDSRALALELIDRITLNEVTNEIRTLLPDPPGVLLVTAPDKADAKGAEPAPSAPDLRAALTRARAATVEAYNDAPVRRDLMETKPERGRVTASRTIEPLGVTVLTFANGIEGWLKPTDFREEEIAFALQGEGGMLNAPSAAFTEASLAAPYVQVAGVGGLNATELRKVLAGKLGGAAPSISSTTTGVNGGSTPSFLETALQLLYLNATAPNTDQAALDLLKRQITAGLVNRLQSPGAVFSDRLSAINASNHYTTEVPTVARIEGLTIAPLLSFYRERFARAHNVRFFMVGAFDVAKVTPLLEQYIGALPAVDRTPIARPAVDLRFPSAIVKERVVKGRDRGAQTAITFPNEPTQVLERMTAEGAATNIVQARLRERLREQLGQTYSVSVGRSATLYPVSTYNTVTIAFGSAPENIDGLVDAVLKELDALRRDGPTDAELRTYQEQQRRSLETNLKQNRFWLAAFMGALSLGHDPLTILARGARIDALTRPTVREAVVKLFPSDRYTVVSLVSENQQSNQLPNQKPDQ